MNKQRIYPSPQTVITAITNGAFPDLTDSECLSRERQLAFELDQVTDRSGTNAPTWTMALGIAAAHPVCKAALVSEMRSALRQARPAGGVR